MLSLVRDMSKIGNLPISVPQGVKIEISRGSIKINGPKGNIEINLPYGVLVKENQGTIKVGIIANSFNDKQGLIRTLISNAVQGVQEEWKKKLEIVGTGYKVRLEGKILVLDIGFSHSVRFEAPDFISFLLEGSNKIVVSGVDKQKVGQVADAIRRIKKPDPYKGKGIRYEGEKIKLKPGKKAKTATA